MPPSPAPTEEAPRRKRGRPRKDPNDLSVRKPRKPPSTPRGRARGRGRGGTKRQLRTRSKPPRNDSSGSEYSDNNDDDEEFKVPLDQAGTKRKKTPKTKASLSVAVKEEEDEEEEEWLDHPRAPDVPRASEQRAIIQRKVSQTTKAQERRRVLWTGPPDLLDLGRNDPLPARNANCIDLATDETVWSTLRETQLAAADIALESDVSVVREYIGGHHSAGNDKGAGDDPPTASLSVVFRGESSNSSNSRVVEIDPLCAVRLCETPGNRGWIANTRQSVLSIDWAPQRHKESPRDTGTICTDYIAVGGLDARSEGAASIGQAYLERDRQPKPGAIQIWAVRTDPMTKQPTMAESCRLDMLLLHTFGRCIMLKWCPISIPQNVEVAGSKVRTIGFLAAIFGDGYLRVCAVPQPCLLRPDADLGASAPVAMYWSQASSLLQVRAPHGIFTSIDWACADLLAACTSKGAITVWPLKGEGREEGGEGRGEALRQRNSASAPYPILNHAAHSGPVSSIHALCVAYKSSGSDKPDENAFTKISAANVQVFSIGSDGRLQRMFLGLPMRQQYPLMRFPVRLYTGSEYWKTHSFLIPDVNNNVRVLAESVLTHLADPIGSSLIDHYCHDSAAATQGSSIQGGKTALWNSDVDWNIVNCHHLDSTLLQVSASEFHPFAAIVGADGQATVQNIESAKDVRRASIMRRLAYSLEWDHAAERLVCYSGRCLYHVPSKKGAVGPFNVFPPQVAVQACAWSKNPLSSAWMASAGAGGFLRIENVSRMPTCI
ncbi:hypothetical protein GGI23_004160 [Coemansia sp. RSA 2559]|nr:hypothetical protein GGI23_004160 [Coemansia sp. RSA 2559]